jgi:hypothetical protein
MTDHPKTDFIQCIGTPFERFILPIIPAGAKLRPDSKLTPDHLGKIPGKFYPGPKEWSGFYKWSANDAKPDHLRKWHGWQDDDQAATAIALALQCGVFLAVDIDENDEAIADEIQNVVIAYLGEPGAIRRRVGSARRVLFYYRNERTAPISKAVVAYRITATDAKSLVELARREPGDKNPLQHRQEARAVDGVRALASRRREKSQWLKVNPSALSSPPRAISKPTALLIARSITDFATPGSHPAACSAQAGCSSCQAALLNRVHRLQCFNGRL